MNLALLDHNRRMMCREIAQHVLAGINSELTFVCQSSHKKEINIFLFIFSYHMVTYDQIKLLDNPEILFLVH